MKKNGKRCGLCDQWLKECRKDTTFCEKCLALIQKHKNCWRKPQNDHRA